MEMFRFAHPDYLYFLFVVPLLVVIFVYTWFRKKRALNQYGDLSIISGLMEEVSYSRPIVKFILVLLALTFVILGIAGPQFGSKLEEVKREGVEIVIALDISNSMMAQDIKPNRLENAKRAITRMLQNLENDKIGLIVFAGDAYTQVPITTDYRATKMMLSTINTDFIPKQGTAIGAAIDLGMNSFSPDTEASKVLVIITDGENHEDEAIEKAKLALEKGIIIHTIGMGLPEGAPIPLARGRDFRKDNQGNIVISKLNETMLTQIASEGNGIYVRANNTKSALNTLFEEIKKMEKAELESAVYSEYDERFQYLIGFALLLILIDFLILERRNRLLKNVRLFD